jgi:hypothetical protein
MVNFWLYFNVLHMHGEHTLFHDALLELTPLELLGAVVAVGSAS